MSERIIVANDIEIWAEEFGEPTNPTCLLIMGGGASGLYWEEEFCQMLADNGRHVIRYDNRDTGRTTNFDHSGDSYTISDMAKDAVAVLDNYQVKAAHIIGASMGGIIGQHVALDHRDRALTLTLIYSTPLVREVNFLSAAENPTDLPGPPTRYLELIKEVTANPPTTRQEWIDTHVCSFEIIAGSQYPLDSERFRKLMTRVYDHADDVFAAGNHGLVIAGSGSDLRPRLKNLRIPTLVIHGTEDPVLPYGHGQALADTIPDARLVTIEGFGHQFGPEIYPLWTSEIIAHTS